MNFGMQVEVCKLKYASFFLLLISTGKDQTVVIYVIQPLYDHTLKILVKLIATKNTADTLENQVSLAGPKSAWFELDFLFDFQWQYLF